MTNKGYDDKIRLADVEDLAENFVLKKVEAAKNVPWG